MNKSIDFFDQQFRHQAAAAALKLNPFEEQALAYMKGEVLDFGCGMGNLAFAAAARGCQVTALDASPTAIAHVQRRASTEGVPVSAAQADLRDYQIARDYDCVVSIGLLMCFDCPTAFRVLAELQEHVRPGGVAVVNVLIAGTSYLELIDPTDHCLFAPSELQNRFAGWAMERCEFSDFEAPGKTVKRFATVIARKPCAPALQGE